MGDGQFANDLFGSLLHVRQHETSIPLPNMSHPTWADFVLRVGGAALAIVVAILIAKVYFPGHEATAAVLASASVVAVAVGLHFRRASRRRLKHSKRQQ